MSTGLFLVRRERICMIRSISVSRPTTGSSLPSWASLVRLRRDWSSLFEDFFSFLLAARAPGRRAALRARALGAALTATAGTRQHADDLVADLLGVGVEVQEDAGGDALVLTDQAEQDVLGADVVVAEAEGLAECTLQHLTGTRRER